MLYEEFGERRVILNLMVLLYNYQTNMTGIKEILNSFMNNTNGFHSYGYNITLPLQTECLKRKAWVKEEEETVVGYTTKGTNSPRSDKEILRN